MRICGELCLLGAFVCSGFAAVACCLGWRRHRVLRISGFAAGIASVMALTVVMLVLAWALAVKDFHFSYVAQYSSELLPWQYSLSALWVGQSGSLLLWSWLTGVLALLYLAWPDQPKNQLHGPVFGAVMAYVCFLVSIMVFAADPMEPSLSVPRDGAGLSPLLQHPAMLIHPPVVFLGYALWTIPFALAAVALITGELDLAWVKQARPWSVLAWAVLGAGILLGAQWSYEELGWGGYWGWDPVENGSLIPWLTGTAMIHGLMTWQYRGGLKKTALALAIATFGLCNFATFLTRSGIFSSLHAFSKSPIGWLFLLLMLVLGIGGATLLVRRRTQLQPERPLQSVFSREAAILISTVALMLLTFVVIAGTLSTALSKIVTGRFIMVGPAFYNNVLIPTGLVLLTTTGLAPLLRWGAAPSRAQRRGMFVSAVAATIAAAAIFNMGLRYPLGLAVVWLAVLAATALLTSLIIDAQRREPARLGLGFVRVLGRAHKQYAGFLIHLGFVAVALGVSGSSLGTREVELLLSEGQSVRWAGYDIQLVRIGQSALPDKLVGNATLEVSRDGRLLATLQPAQHFHLLQQQWTTEVAIHSSWKGDLYTILHDADGPGRVRLTLVENPMMRWLWMGGWIMGVGALIRLLPIQHRSASATTVRHPEPHSTSLENRNRAVAA